ncbi:28S ribosomal protein S23, mitochondrial [Aphelenchoides bicaudatus]|nr:28S ribosomal protein S23, mitochondrial [Aphelenchoides bicaudatus]
MSRFLLSICCCKASEEEDEQYLVLNHDQDEPDNTPQTQVNPIEYTNNINGHAVGNRLTPPDSNGEQTKTREQQEEDLLNRILHHAQESIIDVSHIDDNSSADIDVSQRARAYSEALRKLESKRSNKNDDSNQLSFLITDSSADSSSSSRPQHIQTDEINLILETSKMFGDAVKSGLGIQPTESLIAYISALCQKIAIIYASSVMSSQFFTRAEKAGSIFARITGLIRSGKMKWEERPLWYDAYVTYPPYEEPIWDRKWPKHTEEVRELFYEEDVERAAAPSTGHVHNLISSSKSPTNQKVD